MLNYILLSSQFAEARGEDVSVEFQQFIENKNRQGRNNLNLFHSRLIP